MTSGIGPRIRRSLGRLEIPAAEAYRGLFIDLDHLAAEMKLLPAPARILEIGCGDGALAQRLTRIFPQTEYLGIDLATSAGRLYRGQGNASFRVTPLQELIAEQPEPFDLIVLVDVLHHIPSIQRPSILRAASTLATESGYILIKEWMLGRPLFGKLAYWADWYVTGDRNVEFMSENELDDLVGAVIPGFAVRARSRIRPWRENLLLSMQRT